MTVNSTAVVGVGFKDGAEWIATNGFVFGVGVRTVTASVTGYTSVSKS
jgi:hypothetical protein